MPPSARPTPWAGGLASAGARPGTPNTTGRPALSAQVIHFINKPMPGNLPKKTSRALLGLEDPRIVPIIRDPAKLNEDSDAVFYFPGCGSERLFSQVGLATQAMLFELGAQTVLPPGYLCCGYPQTSAGRADLGEAITTENRVLFHRVANTLNYLDIRTVIVSCGTCMDQLMQYQFDRIFPGCRLLDIHEYLMEKGVKLDGVEGEIPLPRSLPHADEDPSSRQGGERADGPGGEALRPLLRRVRHPGRHETGHLHPDPLPQAGRNRTRQGRTGPGHGEDADRLPLLPAGAVALHRRNRRRARLHRGGAGEKILGPNWMADYVARASDGGIERVLL